MFRAVFRLQWRASFTAVSLIAVAGFIVPLLAVQRAGFAVGDRRAWDLVTMLATVESAGSLFPILAIMLGLTLSVSAWSAGRTTRLTRSTGSSAWNPVFCAGSPTYSGKPGAPPSRSCPW